MNHISGKPPFICLVEDLNNSHWSTNFAKGTDNISWIQGIYWEESNCLIMRTIRILTKNREQFCKWEFPFSTQGKYIMIVFFLIFHTRKYRWKHQNGKRKPVIIDLEYLLFILCCTNQFMKQFLFFWFWAVIYVLCDMMKYSLWLSSISQFFFAVFLVVMLPLWIYWLMELKERVAMEYSIFSLPRVVLFICISIFFVWYFALSFPEALTIIFILASLSGFMSAWVLLLVSILILCMMPVVSIVENDTVVKILAQYSYYGLAWWFIANIFAPWITNILKRISWMDFSPQEWQLYIREIQSILRGFIRTGSYIFLLCLLYIVLQKESWLLYLSHNVPMFIILFIYIAFLIVPFQSRKNNPFTITL